MSRFKLLDRLRGSVLAGSVGTSASEDKLLSSRESHPGVIPDYPGLSRIKTFDRAQRIMYFIEMPNRDDLLVIYSDGITEAQSTTEAFFNEAGILDIVGRHAGSEPLELAKAICAAAEAFERGNQSVGDDKTVVVVRVGGGH